MANNPVIGLYSCPKCRLYYKPILGHKCKKENDHVQSISLS